MKKYWFYLEPYTFLWEKQEKVMLYNSLSGTHILFEPDSATKPIVTSWNNADNLYGIELTEADIEKESVKDLIFQVREAFSGDIIELGAEQQPPVSLKPFLNFQMDRQRLANLKAGEANRQYGEKVLQHLYELTIYVDGMCMNDCPYCSSYLKQIICCTKQNNNFLQPQQIERFLQSISNSGVGRINILGGDLLSNSLLPEYINVFSLYGFTKNYYSHYLNINEHAHLLNLPNTTLQVIVTFPVDEQKLEKAFKLLKEINNLNYCWVFVISSELEYSQTETLIKRFNIQNSTIKPFYNGNNYDFFSENLFTTIDDLQSIQLNRRQIFARQYINAADFGKLTVMPDGKIYANINHEALGTIDDDIRKLIYNELVSGKSWLRTRNQKPCVDCVYQWLCQSPSNYEIAIGRSNLCHVKNNK